jgi:hypothetical protein
MSTERVLRATAWLLWGVWLGLATFSVVLATQVSLGALLAVATVGYSSVGALVATRQPHNAVGWMLLVFAIALSASATAEPYASTGAVPLGDAAAWLAQWADYVWVALALVFLPLVFPNGHLVSRRWWAAVWLGAVALMMTVVGAAFMPYHPYADVENPLAVHGGAGQVFTAMEVVGEVVLGLSALLAGVSLVVRYERAGSTERQQLKWFAFAAGLIGSCCAFLGVTISLPATWAESVSAVAWSVLLAVMVVAVPPAIGVAILRHRLYDIDLVINRSLVYAALTATLLTTYVVSVLVLGRVLTPLTGDSNLAVAASTLAAAALFRPARRRIQKAVDRRFYRHKYDAARTLDDFTTRLRHELDLDAVRVDLSAAVSETLQPSHLSVWIRP